MLFSLCLVLEWEYYNNDQRAKAPDLTIVEWEKHYKVWTLEQWMNLMFQCLERHLEETIDRLDAQSLGANKNSEGI